MVAYPLNDKIRKLFYELIEDPVFYEILSGYSVDNKYLYIPKVRFSDKAFLQKLLDDNKVIDKSP